MRKSPSILSPTVLKKRKQSPLPRSSYTAAGRLKETETDIVKIPARKVQPLNERLLSMLSDQEKQVEDQISKLNKILNVVKKKRKKKESMINFTNDQKKTQELKVPWSSSGVDITSDSIKKEDFEISNIEENTTKEDSKLQLSNNTSVNSTIIKKPTIKPKRSSSVSKLFNRKKKIYERNRPSSTSRMLRFSKEVLSKEKNQSKDQKRKKIGIPSVELKLHHLLIEHEEIDRVNRAIQIAEAKLDHERSLQIEEMKRKAKTEEEEMKARKSKKYVS